MAKFNMTVPYGLFQDEAIRRMETLFLQRMVEKSDGKITDVQQEWKDNIGNFSFSAMGSSISGTIAVKLLEIEFSGIIPFKISLFKGKIESIIREETEKLLS